MIKRQFLRSIVELFDKSKDPSTAANANTDGVGDYISSVSWVKEGNIVAVGDNNGVVELWDVTRSKLMRKMRGHTSRVATLDWNAHILASGKQKMVDSISRHELFLNGRETIQEKKVWKIFKIKFLEGA